MLRPITGPDTVSIGVEVCAEELTTDVVDDGALGELEPAELDPGVPDPAVLDPAVLEADVLESDVGAAGELVAVMEEPEVAGPSEVSTLEQPTANTASTAVSVAAQELRRKGDRSDGVMIRSLRALDRSTWAECHP